MTDKPRRKPRPAGSRAHPIKADVSGAFDGGRSDIEGLKEEMEDWQSNLESNNMEHLPKFDEVSQAYDALEEVHSKLESLEVPDFLEELDASHTHDTRLSKQSRATRLDNAINALDAAKSAAEAWLDDNEELMEGDADDYDGDPDDFITEEAANERREQREKAEEFVNELDEAIGEAGNVDFPSMMR